MPVLALVVSGCAVLSPFGSMTPRECMTRVMYFESNRSSEEGMLAVGTVVMNRVADPAYPKTVCGVVGQKNHFAPGVLSKPMTEKRSVQRATQVADMVLKGKRHAVIPSAKHFHQAGLRFPYNNMHYVLEAGGNEFYNKY
jgi:spore germination cell wall hydrolase CwlJ-like protein